MFAFFCNVPVPPALVVEVRDAIRAAARETHGKQEAAAIEAGYDAPRFSRDINGPAAVFVARLVRAGLLPKVLEKIGAEQALKARVEDHERRIASLESKKEIA
jgi:hypothetical protein